MKINTITKNKVLKQGLIDDLNQLKELIKLDGEKFKGCKTNYEMFLFNDNNQFLARVEGFLQNEFKLEYFTDKQFKYILDNTKNQLLIDWDLMVKDKAEMKAVDKYFNSASTWKELPYTR